MKYSDWPAWVTCSVPELMWWSHRKHVAFNTKFSSQNFTCVHDTNPVGEYCVVLLEDISSIDIWRRLLSFDFANYVAVDKMFSFTEPYISQIWWVDKEPCQAPESIMRMKCEHGGTVLHEKGKKYLSQGEGGSMTFHLSEPHLQAPVGSVLENGFLLHFLLKEKKLHFPLIWCLDAAFLSPPLPQGQEASFLSPEEARFITPIKSSYHAAMTWTKHPQLANVDHFQQKMKHEICKNNEPFTEIPVAATGQPIWIAVAILREETR